MREEYNSVLLTLAEADKIDPFGQYRYIGKTQISAWPIYRSISRNDLQHCLLLICEERLLSRELIWLRIHQVDQNESFKDGHLIKSFELFKLTIWLLSSKKTNAWVMLCKLFVIKGLTFRQCKNP